MAWETLASFPAGAVTVTASANGSRTTVRVVVPWQDDDGNEHLNSRQGLSIPAADDPLVGCFADDVAEAIRSAFAALPKPKPTTKSGKATVKHGDPAVIAALASNPEALAVYLASLS